MVHITVRKMGNDVCPWASLETHTRFEIYIIVAQDKNRWNLGCEFLPPHNPGTCWLNSGNSSRCTGSGFRSSGRRCEEHEC